jgi:hypothetical protein
MLVVEEISALLPKHRFDHMAKSICLQSMIQGLLKDSLRATVKDLGNLLNNL